MGEGFPVLETVVVIAPVIVMAMVILRGEESCVIYKKRIPATPT